MKKPIDRLNEDYQFFVDNMNEWQSYEVKLYSSEKEVRTMNMLAYNESHLLIEVAQFVNFEYYKSNSEQITRIDYKLNV